MELPHFHVLHGNARAQRHTDTVTRVDVCIRGRCVNTACTTSRKNSCFRLNVDSFSRLDANRDYTNHGTVLVFDQVSRKPFIEEYSLVLDVVLVERVEQRMACSVCSRASTGRLTAFTIILGLTTKRTLVDASLFCTRERQPHVLQLKDGLRTHRAHVFDRVLISDVVTAFYSVVHVPAPIILRICTCNCTSDTTLRAHGV